MVVAICYVLPVCGWRHVFSFHIMERIVQNQTTRMFPLSVRRRYLGEVCHLWLHLINGKSLIYYFAPVMDATYCDQYICMSSLYMYLCWHIAKITCPNITKFSVHVTYGRRSDLFWQQCIYFRFCGFFSHNGARNVHLQARSSFPCSTGSSRSAPW